ncbi:MAG: winged helix-turn-helix domain-containing protein [Acidobacteriota bacterium]|nr:winged helix-turn-helix domain-containing protein [Acidobacteriota bacterium]
MTETQTARRYRFGAFEVDTTTGELRRQGIRIKLNAQPFQVLSLLLDRPGELLTREQISRELWPDGTFVDYEHGVNSAVNRIREALGDTAGNPRFVETLARRGYRFVAPVERINPERIISIDVPPTPPELAPDPNPKTPTALDQPEPDADAFTSFLASPHELPRTSYPVVQTLFVLLQLMYLGFYVGALFNLPEIEDLLSPVSHATELYLIMIVTAAVLIIVRTFIVSMIAFKAPRAQQKFLHMWPFLMPFDELWALAPFLLLHHISFGVALACVALLVYSPFAQRALVLMGAGCPRPDDRR